MASPWATSGMLVSDWFISHTVLGTTKCWSKICSSSFRNANSLEGMIVNTELMERAILHLGKLEKQGVII